MECASGGPRLREDSNVAARVLIQLLRDGEAVEFVANGRSMWPMILGGSVVRVEPCGADALVEGDIGAYESRGGIIVHRLVEKRADGRLIFRGDFLAGNDGPVEPAAVLGTARVVRHRTPRIRLPQVAEIGAVLRAARWIVRRMVARA